MSSLMKKIFVRFSRKAYGVFNRSTLTIEEYMHVKFEESNALVKNVIEINFLVEDMEKISLKDSHLQEDDKPKDDKHGEPQDVEVEPTQSLPKDWRCNKSSQRSHLR